MLNASFSRFSFEEDALRRFAAYPPAPVPFGEYRLGGGAEVALYQQVGRLKTQKPLLVFGGSPEQRRATLLTDGGWQWRLQEAADHADRPDAYDRLISRTLQLLTANANKKRLDVYPTQDAFTTADEITFGAETYNAIFERIYGQQIALTLTDEQQRVRTYSFTNSEDGAPLRLGPLPGGVYRYVARATLGGQNQQDRANYWCRSSSSKPSTPAPTTICSTSLPAAAARGCITRSSSPSSPRIFKRPTTSP